MAPEFEPFSKIPRLRRTCTITEKIDGTNAQLYFSEDGELHAGSRNRWLSPGKMTDNYGFATWATDHKEALFETLGPGRHYGEWWGVGINRGYGLHERRFSLFNASKWGEVDFDAAGLPNVCTVPELYVGEFTTAAVVECLHWLEFDGSVAAPHFARPEGIVVFHHASRHLYKVTFEGDGEQKKSNRRADDLLPELVGA